MPDKPPLTAEYILGLYQWGLRQQQERGLRQYIREVRELYDMRRKVRIPKEYQAIAQEVRTPFFRDVTLRITSSLVKDPPIDKVEARDDTGDARKAASTGGRWLNAIKKEMTALAQDDVVYLNALNTVLDVEGVIKVVHRPDAWANFPEREADEAPERYTRRAERHAKGGVYGPFAWRAVDRQQMLFGDGEYGDEWAMEYGEYAMPYLDRVYVNDPNNPTPETALAGPPHPEGYGFGSPRSTKIEFFDATEWAVVVNGKMAPGFPKPNPYAPMLPYIRCQTVPVMYPLRWLVPALDALLTMRQNWAYLSAFPVVVIEALAGVQRMLSELPTGDTSEPPNITWHPGRGFFPPPGYSMKFLSPPATGQDLNAMIQEIREMIDVAGIPNIMRGVAGFRQAGYSVNMLMTAASVMYRKVTEALQRQQENVDRFLFHCVKETIGQTVYVLGSAEGDTKQWLGVRPTGKVLELVAPVDQLGPPTTLFRTLLPTDEQAQEMIALQSVNSPHPLYTVETAIAHHLPWIEDPQQEVDNIWAERSLDEEPLKSEIIIEAKRLAGLRSQPASPPAELNAPPAGPEAVPQPTDIVTGGQPTVPGLTQPVMPNTPLPTVGPGVGGRVAGAYPGQP